VTAAPLYILPLLTIALVFKAKYSVIENIVKYAKMNEIIYFSLHIFISRGYNKEWKGRIACSKIFYISCLSSLLWMWLAPISFPPCHACDGSYSVSGHDATRTSNIALRVYAPGKVSDFLELLEKSLHTRPHFTE
jgi:hypothetical protein